MGYHPASGVRKSQNDRREGNVYLNRNEERCATLGGSIIGSGSGNEMTGSVGSGSWASGRGRSPLAHVRNYNLEIWSKAPDVGITRACRGSRRTRSAVPFRGLGLFYFSAAMPAAAICPSCADVTPDTPMAPTIFPPITRGNPPSMGVAPGSRKVRRPSPPAATLS